MKLLNNLLKYRDYFHYISYEIVIIRAGDERDQAILAYSEAIRNCFLSGENKWALDIALDCLRNLKAEEIEQIQKTDKIEEYHFGLGLWVRNRYIFPSNFHFYISADRISSLVKDFLIAIICPSANPFKKS